MTPKKLVLLLLLLVGCTNANTYAGHIIRKTHIVDEAHASAEPPALVSAAEPSEAGRKITALQSDEKGRRQARDTSGWEGIVSLVCGVLGIFTFGLASIPAIIFGALGMGRGKKHQGLSLAGLILGVVTILVYAMLIFAIASAF